MRRVLDIKTIKCLNIRHSGISAVGSALASGVRGRRFKSAIPDIFFLSNHFTFFIRLRPLKFQFKSFISAFYFKAGNFSKKDFLF